MDDHFLLTFNSHLQYNNNIKVIRKFKSISTLTSIQNSDFIQMSLLYVFTVHGNVLCIFYELTQHTVHLQLTCLHSSDEQQMKKKFENKIKKIIEVIKHLRKITFMRSFYFRNN